MDSNCLESTKNFSFIQSKDLYFELNILFSLLDKNDLGYLDTKVFRKYCEKNMTNHQINKLINELDQDGDGKIYKNDFIEKLNKFKEISKQTIPSNLISNDRSILNCSKSKDFDFLKNKLTINNINALTNPNIGFNCQTKNLKCKKWINSYQKLVCIDGIQNLNSNLYDQFEGIKIDDFLSTLTW